MKNVIAILLLSVATYGCLHAQNNLAPNVRLYLSKTPHVASRNVADDMMLRAYLCVDSTLNRSVLQDMGIRIRLDLKDVLTADIPTSQLQSLSAIPSIKYVQLAESVKPQMDKARAQAGVNFLHSGEGLPGSFTGKGVVVGVIDAGFDYTHPSFYSSDGKSLRIQRVWEQDYSKGSSPSSYGYGTELTTSEAILKAGGDMSVSSHGTHVAGIAAGAYAKNDWYGVAPDAELVLVSMSNDTLRTMDNVNVSDAIAYIFNYADSVQKPCVINMSLGSQIGPHDGTSFFDRIANRLQGEGKLLVGSSGNFGNAPIHVGHYFTSSDDAPLKTMVAFNEKPDAKSADAKIDIWGDAVCDYDVQLVVYNYKNGQVAQESQKISASDPQGNISVFELTSNAKGSITITTEVNPFNQKPHALLNLSVKSLRNGYAIGLIIQPRSSGAVHAWADNTHVTFTNNGLAEWTDGDTRYSLAEIGGTADGVLSVGAYTTRNTYLELNGTNEKNTGEELGAIASFSSVGPAVDGRMKPDVSAPGSYIISSMSSHYAGLSSHPLAAYEEWNGSSYPYGYMQGTSMAAPFVTGVLATWLQANPQLAVSDVRNILHNTSVCDENVLHTTDYHNVWGYGKIDALAGLKYLLSTSDILMETYSEPFEVYFTQGALRVCVLHPSVTSVSVGIYSFSGLQVEQFTANYSSIQVHHEFSLAHLTRGVYLARVTTNKGSKTCKVFIE